MLLYLKFKNKKSTFKYLINRTDNIIIKGTHKTKCSQSGGEKFISTIIASRTIKIFKKNIAKKLGPSPRSWFDRLNPQSHLSFIFKKVLNTDCLPHWGQHKFWRIYINEGLFFKI